MQPNRKHAPNHAGPCPRLRRPIPPATRKCKDLSVLLWAHGALSESFAHNEFFPNGAERNGTARFSLATGGTSLIEEVHSDGSAGRLDFMVVIWWDNEAKVYNFFTCGNGGNNPCKIRGTAHWDGDSFVNDYELTIRGAKKRWKDTFSEITPISFTLAAAMESMNGTALQPMITTQYRKQ